MKQKDNIVFVDGGDDLTSVLDSVLNNVGDVVYVVLNDDTNIASNILNLRLLKREADGVGKRVVIVTKNGRFRELAERAGISTLNESPKAETEPRKYAKALNSEHSGKRIVSDIIVRPVNAAKAVEKAIPPSVPTFAQRLEQAPEEKSAKEKATRRGIAQRFIPIRRRLSRNLLQISGAELLRNKNYMGRGINGFLIKLPRFLLQSPKWTFAGISALAVFLVILFVVLSVLPRVTLSITPQSIEDTISFTLVFDTNVTTSNFERNIIPAQIFEETGSKSAQFEASGQAEVNENAAGTIRVFNEFSSSPQTLVANTRFLSSDGKLFRTTETVVVPGAKIDDGKIIASSTTVEVRAADPGEAFNIGSSTFSIPGFKGTPKFLSFYGKSESAMEGGFKGVRAIITGEDEARAREELRVNLLDKLTEILRTKVPSNLIMIDDSLSVEFIKFDVRTDGFENSNKFSIDADGVARVFLVQKEDVEAAIQYNFRTSNEFSQDFELSSQRSISYIVKDADYEKGVARTGINVVQTFNRVVGVEGILEEIKGKNEVEVRRILASYEELASAQVRFWPFWVKSVPRNVEDITVEVNKK
ncbi:MAG: hypothetical protein A2932_00635 [Candidatus Spechtbacteria bacterium RIFCSPLOWO2_01_FULL_46_10]|uniref:Baseplate protein J-like domain-containing protein n=1 Tax=Candidatus Spechtbacteria bacterium RIFCSPLOWO2_01_FULL_46_10 TaxID=1802163 RepID=A0A1G2HI75_9BACT|nr:MAG: hypothetical protein A2932_00635 [Candidatus Spechtbacteria bacterium RIFCSPLOWO2_01_FULL_46_10]